MRYSYEKNLTLLERKLRQINMIEDDINGFKDIVCCVIAVNRDDLLFCIHLSNRNFDEIKLENEIYNEALLNGIMPFKQTRLELLTKWKLIII